MSSGNDASNSEIHRIGGEENDQLCIDISESKKNNKKQEKENVPKFEIHDELEALSIKKQHMASRTVTVSGAGIFEVNGLYRWNFEDRTWDQEVREGSSSGKKATREYKIINIGKPDTKTGPPIFRWTIGLLREGDQIAGPKHKMYYSQFGSAMHDAYPSETRSWVNVFPVRKTSDLPTISVSNKGCPCCGREE